MANKKRQYLKTEAGQLPKAISASVIRRALPDEKEYNEFVRKYLASRTRSRWLPTSTDWKYYQEGKMERIDWEAYWKKSKEAVWRRLGKMYFLALKKEI